MFMVANRRVKEQLLDLKMSANVIAKQEFRDTLTALGALAQRDLSCHARRR
jgi:hypothetical protein